MSIEFFQEDDTTPFEDFPIPDFEAGETSGTIVVHVFNNKGNALGQAAPNLTLGISVEHPTIAELFVRSGFPPVDEMWPRFRIIGFDNSLVPGFSVNSTDWKPVGANAELELGDMPSGAGIYVEMTFEPPSYATLTPWRFALGARRDDFARAAAAGLSEVDRGILPLVGDFAQDEILLGGRLTPTGTPDAAVQIAASQVVAAGALLGRIKTSITFNQNDSAAAALAVGEKYRVAIYSTTSGWGSVKGEKDTAPDDPAVPAGGRLRGYVTVRYQVGGTSVIEASDIENVGLYGRYYIEAGDGLELHIHRGTAIGGGTYRFSHGKQTIVLGASATAYLYQLATGLFDMQATEVPPEHTALGPWATVTTDTDEVTVLVDHRVCAGRSRVLTLKGAIPGSPGFIDDIVIQDELLWLEEVLFRVSDNGGGASGLTRLDVRVNGTTIFTDHATEDHRGTFAFNASTLIASTRFHQVTKLKRGDVVSFHNTDEPSGGTPARGEVSLLCRLP